MALPPKQTEAPRPGGGRGWPGLRLREDIVGTEDGMAKYPYIREARRIKAEFTVVEHPVEWNIGESAGVLAAHAVAAKSPPRRIRNQEKLLREFQQRLEQQEIEREWPRVTPR